MTLSILYPPKVKDAVRIGNNLPYNYSYMNLNIEGTKHEKAVLVILSYVSGFTAGFIIFGMSALLSARPAESVIYHEPQATNISMNTVDQVSAPTEQEAPAPTEEVMYKDGRLMANVNGASVLLSAQLATVDAETAKTFANQGVHQAIPKYQASDDANFVYYCEQHSELAQAGVEGVEHPRQAQSPKGCLELMGPGHDATSTSVLLAAPPAPLIAKRRAGPWRCAGATGGSGRLVVSVSVLAARMPLTVR